MKAKYEKELNKVTLHIDLPRMYEADYQIYMLQENQITGLLEVAGYGLEGKSRYSYTVTGLSSMKNMFETSAIKREDMLCFVNRLMETVKSLRRYLLNPDGLLLYPEFMFYGDGTWFFCYLPGRKKSLCQAFHVITEYFVRKLDYEDTEGILLAYELHKATLQENYDLEKIMEEYKLHDEKRKQEKRSQEEDEDGFLPVDNIFSVEEDTYEPAADVETIREMGARWNPWKKAADKQKKGRWGSWKDLIFETDGQEKEEPL